MNKILSLLSLAVLTIGLLGSCSKINERLDGLDKRINNLENDKIASVEQQIAAINQSIADLGTIRTNIQTLIEAKTAQGEDITKLKEADQTLEGKIAELKTYLDTNLAKYATTEWVNATFATLAKQAEIIADVTKLKQDLAGLEAALDQAIEDLDSSLKAWVNEQLSAYSTTAQMEAKIKALQDQIDALKADNETNKSDIEDLEADLAQLEQDLESAKATIKTAYEKAIKDALESNNGYITEKIKRAISSANGSISSLSSRVRDLELDVADLREDVDALKGMIQSVTIIPAYSDGSVEAEGNNLKINFIVSPASALENVSENDIKVLVNTVKTKSATYTTVSATIAEINKNTGYVSITANISSITVGTGQALTVAVNISSGISDFTTEFVPVYAPTPVVPEGFVDLGVTTAEGNPLYWAKCNLGANNPQDPGDYYMWGATALMYTDVDYSKTTDAFTFVTANPYGDNYKNTWDASKGFSWNNVPFAEGVYNNSNNKKVFTKYTTSNDYAKSGTPDNIKTLNPEDDAARAKNAHWRMPTKDEFLDLRANCVWIWTTNYNGTGTGYIVYKAKNGDSGMAYYSDKWHKWNRTQSKYEDYTGQVSTYEPSDNHIFLPAAGIGSEAKLNNYNKGGCYWSSSLATSDNLAFALSFMSTGFNISEGQRQYGYTIRPVTE